MTSPIIEMRRKQRKELDALRDRLSAETAPPADAYRKANAANASAALATKNVPDNAPVKE